MKPYLLSFLLLAACDIDGDPTMQDDGPSEISITGQAAEVSHAGLAPLANVAIAAYQRTDDVTPIAQATTDMLGHYRLVLPIDAETPFEGYLQAKAPGFVDTYLYLSKPVNDFYLDASLRMVTPETFDLLGDACAADQLPSSGMIAAIVMQGGQRPIADATVTTTPASNRYCYNGATGTPDSVRVTTAADGVAYMFNVTGPVTVTASMGKLALRPRNITARADVLTLVLIAPY